MVAGLGLCVCVVGVGGGGVGAEKLNRRGRGDRAT